MDIIWALAVSTHLGLTGDYNSIHPHVRISDDNIIAGAYYNSEERLSLYGGYNIDLTDTFAFEVGIVSGYPAIGTVIPYARAVYDYGKINFFVAPAFEKYDNEIQHGLVLGVEYIIDK